MPNFPSEIINIAQKQHHFWQDLDSWAPEEVQDILTGARLDWGLQLTEKLKDFFAQEKQNDIELILAWTTLGALLEQTLKLFLCVFYLHYLDDPIKRDGVVLDPRTLMLGQISKFIKRKEILPSECRKIIRRIQDKRNAIHTFDGREIGTFEDFYKAVNEFYNLQLEIELRLPYPK